MNNYFEVISPHNDQTFLTFTHCDKTLIQNKIDILEAEKNKITKTNKTLQYLEVLSEKIKNNSDKLAKTITAEIGKTSKDAQVEIARAITTIQAIKDARAALSGDLLEGQNYIPGDDKLGLVSYAPLGIVLAITPFNFPINLALHKIVPALAMGNKVLFKPHPQCYKSSKILVELFYNSGFCETDIQMICPSNDLMSYVVSHPSINCVSFTGGEIAAQAVSSAAILKKQLYELGGNDALAVYPNSNYSKAVSSIINQRFGCSGQRCTASKRVYIHDECYENVKDLLVKETKKLVMGDPSKPETFIGPVVSKNAAKEIENRINQTINLGADLICGGKRVGAFVEPTIIENVSSASPLIQNETFGPVVPLFKFNSTDDLIFKVNSTNYGLQCGVFTDDINTAKKLFNEINVGSLVINEGPGYRADHFPFGGSKASGIGREGAKYALLEFSQTKTLII